MSGVSKLFGCMKNTFEYRMVYFERNWIVTCHIIRNYCKYARSVFPKYPFSRVWPVLSTQSLHYSSIFFIETRGSEYCLDGVCFRSWLKCITKILLLVRVKSGRNKTLLQFVLARYWYSAPLGKVINPLDKFDQHSYHKALNNRQLPLTRFSQRSFSNSWATKVLSRCSCYFKFPAKFPADL
jgi:hypothetical protein